MCLIDQRERRFTDVNPSWERVLGWTRKELCAVPYTHFMHPEDVCIAEFEDNLANQRTTGGYSLLNRYRNKEGKWITLEWYAAIFGPSINYAVAKIFHTAKIVENPSLFTEVSDVT
jgi:PAS domain S-box-containing protein